MTGIMQSFCREQFSCALICSARTTLSLGIVLSSLISVTNAYALSDRATQMGLAPHKALYNIEMATNKSGSQIVNISGQMFYEWQPTCDAWVSNHRFNLLYEYPDNPAMRITSDFSTYEAFDGKSMNFTSQRKRDGELFEELRGSAKLEEGTISEAKYTIPQDLIFQLPPGTLFPMAHTLDVLEKIKTGKKFYAATIFDGSDEEGPVEVNSFIGKAMDKPPILSLSKESDKNLVNTKAWNVRLAFFPTNKSESTSDYEMSLVLHENGVVSDILIEYQDFSVRQKLVAIEPLSDSCGENKNNKQKGGLPPTTPDLDKKN